MKRDIPRSSDRVEGGNDARNINASPFRNIYFRDQNRQRENHAIEEESEHMRNDLSHKEKAVDHVKLLIQGNFLHTKDNLVLVQ